MMPNRSHKTRSGEVQSEPRGPEPAAVGQRWRHPLDPYPVGTVVALAANHVWIRWDGHDADDAIAGLYPSELGYIREGGEASR